MRIKKVIALCLFVALIMPTIACGGGAGEPGETVKDFLDASGRLEPERMASYWVPEMRRDMISTFEDAFEPGFPISNWAHRHIPMV